MSRPGTPRSIRIEPHNASLLRPGVIPPWRAIAMLPLLENRGHAEYLGVMSSAQAHRRYHFRCCPWTSPFAPGVQYVV